MGVSGRGLSFGRRDRDGIRRAVSRMRIHLATIAALCALTHAACGGQQTGPGGKPWEEPRAQKLDMMEMTTARADHVGVAIGDGRVLLAAGTATAEVGTVLVAGGKSGRFLAGPQQGNLDNFTPLNTADIFDPETGNYVPTGNMHATHYVPTATRLQNGTVLVVDGWRMQSPIIFGMRDADLFDPAQDGFRSIGRTRIARLNHTTTLLPDGSAMVAGGIDGSSHVSPTVEFFSPAAGRFEVRPLGAPTAAVPPSAARQ